MLARRSARLAAALLALFPLTSGARAGEVSSHLKGKVVLIQATDWNTNAATQLAARGVTLGASADVTIKVESTTPGQLVQSVPHDFMSYPMAVTELTLSVGSWEAHLAPPPGLEFSNFVNVANDADAGGGKADSWSCAVIGVDTDMICSAGEFTNYSSFVSAFVAVPPKASKDDGLVQDLAKYKNVALLSFSGPGGLVEVSFAGGIPGPGVDPAARARQGQLRAAAALGSRVLKGLGKFAAAPPEKDPLGVAEDALLLDASESFGTQFLKAVDKAVKKGGSAPLGESGKAAATKFLMGGLQAQGDAITAGADGANPADRALRGKLLQALAANCRADFAAHSKDVKKPDADKLAKALARSRAKLDAAVGKALEKAAAQGVVYEGPAAQGLADALAPFVDDFVALTETGVD